MLFSILCYFRRFYQRLRQYKTISLARFHIQSSLRMTMNLSFQEYLFQYSPLFSRLEDFKSLHYSSSSILFSLTSFWECISPSPFVLLPIRRLWIWMRPQFTHYCQLAANIATNPRYDKCLCRCIYLIPIYFQSYISFLSIICFLSFGKNILYSLNLIWIRGDIMIT